MVLGITRQCTLQCNVKMYWEGTGRQWFCIECTGKAHVVCEGINVLGNIAGDGYPSILQYIVRKTVDPCGRSN
jgi:hypothetical protein